MKKILVPVDFTPASRAASEYAASLAQMVTAQLHLLHVYMEPTPATEVPSAWMITGSNWQEEVENQITKEVEYLKSTYAITITGEAILGYVGDTIKEVAASTEAVLVVMGMKKEKTSTIFGSSTQVAIRKSPVPILIVPEGAGFKPFRQIVFASDFEEVTNTSSFNLLIELIEKFQSELCLLHVRKEGEDISPSEVPGRIQMGRILANIQNCRYEEVIENEVDKGIQNFVDGHPTDLLVMISRPHNIFQRLFGTVHTRSISYTTECPLLVLKDYD